MVKDRWVKGWDGILAFTGVRMSATIEKYETEYCFPLRRLPTGEPVLIVSEANEWLRAFTELSSPFRKRKLSGAALKAALEARDKEIKSKHKEVVNNNG